MHLLPVRLLFQIGGREMKRDLEKKPKAGLCLLMFSQGNIWFTTAFPFVGILGRLGVSFFGN